MRSTTYPVNKCYKTKYMLNSLFQYFRYKNKHLCTQFPFMIIPFLIVIYFFLKTCFLISKDDKYWCHITIVFFNEPLGNLFTPNVLIIAYQISS